MKALRTLSMAIAIMVCTTSTAFAWGGDWLPAEKGDTWSYRTCNNQETTTTIDRTIGSWSHYDDFAGAGELWIWAGTGNRAYLLGQRGAQEWMNFLKADNPGGNYPGSAPLVSFGTCNQDVAATFSGLEDVVVPAGTFTDCAKVTFQTSCSDAGLMAIWIAKSVGIVKYETLSPSGTQTLSLFYAKVSGKEYKESLATAETITVTGTFSHHEVVSTDLTVLTGTLLIKNNTAVDQVLTLRSQELEILIKNQRGQIVKAWSAGRSFPTTFTKKTIVPGEMFVLTDTMVVSNYSGGPLTPGLYTVHMKCVSNKPYGFQAPLTVR